LDVPKTFRPFQKGRSVANELQFVVLQISVHLQQMGKIGPFKKSRKVFLAHPKWAERFFRAQKNFFSNKNAMKVNESSTKATENPREKSF
jgi:hypothetical protein